MKSSHSQKFMPKIFVYVFFWIFMLSDYGHSRPQSKSPNNGVPAKEIDSSVLNRTVLFPSSSLTPMSSSVESGLIDGGNTTLLISGNRKRRSASLDESSLDSQALTEDDSELGSQEPKRNRNHASGFRSKKKGDSPERDSVDSDENDLAYPHSQIYREKEDENLAKYIYYVINDFIDDKEDVDIRTGGASFHSRHHNKDLHSETPSSHSSEQVNLVRKRRQKSSPLDHRRHKGEDAHRRRQRRRNRRHRHLLPTTDNNLSEGEHRSSGEKFPSRHPDGFFLKSDSPSYIITSASELKKDWCRTIPLPQKVVEKNCKTKVVMNNFCYGQCNSFFIPHPGRRGSQGAFQSCAFCKPHRLKWTNVTLHCPGQNPPKKEKRIMMVESCRCITEVLQ